MKFYDQDIKNVLKELESSKEGITNKEATKRLEKSGYNKLVEGKKKSKLVKFLNQFNDLMILILIGVMILTFIYALLLSHDYTDTIVIFVVVVLNALMGFIQEEKAEVTLDGLKQYANWYHSFYK